MEELWRKCSACEIVFFCDKSFGLGRCPATGAGHVMFAGAQLAVMNSATWLGQSIQGDPLVDPTWRRCLRCNALFSTFPSTGSRCFATGDAHDATSSPAYMLPRDASVQSFDGSGWRKCINCQGLFLNRRISSAVTQCPAGGQHVPGTQPYQPIENHLGETIYRTNVGQVPSGKWTNWAKSLEENQLGEIYRPSSLSQLVSIVQRATRLHAHVRAVGSSWSFSGAVKPDRYSILVETDALNRTPGTVISQFPAEERENYLHLMGGMKIRDAYTLADRRGLAFPTQGGSGGQSIVGAISTGTHGSDVFLPSIADMVEAIHLVGFDGIQFWIQRPGALPTEAMVRRAYPYMDAAQPGFNNFIVDQDTFDAVLVSMGTMGIIYSLLIKPVRAFNLRETMRKTDWAAVSRDLRDNGSSGETFRFSSDLPVRYVEITLPPNTAPGRATRRCTVSKRVAEPAMVPRSEPPPPRPSGTLSELCRMGPGLVNWIVQSITWPAFLGALPAAATLVPGGISIGSALYSAFVLDVQLTLASARSVSDYLSRVSQLCARYNVKPLIRELAEPLIIDNRGAPSSQGPSWWIMDGMDYNQPDCILVDSMEGFFPIANGDFGALVDRIDAVLRAIDDAGTGYGYVSLRFTGTTTAMLGMQQGPPGAMVCSLELVLIKDQPDNESILRKAQEAVLVEDRLLHWGQRNEVLLDPRWREQLNDMYPRLPAWRAVRQRLSDFTNVEGAAKVFSNEFFDRLLNI
jgi:hypothetical protein